MSAHDALTRIWPALGGAPGATEQVRFTGPDSLASVFPVGDLAAASVAAAALAVARFAGNEAPVVVDRRRTALWFATSIQPDGWDLPAAWDAVAGDYQGRDGWIRLHTNAPHHRAAALRVLDCAPQREAVTQAVRGWAIDALEQAVVDAGGAAAAMRSAAAWATHPQGSAVAGEPLVARTAHSGPARRAADPTRPLAGLRVLDLTRVLAGPTSTRFLAGFGAEVLRLDPPGWEEPRLAPDMTLGKTCARIDLRRDRATFLALLGRADIIVHGYRPGALAGLGLDEAARRAARPGLVDVCLDAYGWSGPWAGRRGFDSLVQMSSGIAEAGQRWRGAERPVPLPVQALDFATGYLMAASVVLGLAQGGLTARLSLARTAALLGALPLERDEFAFAHPPRSNFLFDRVIQTYGDSASGHHALAAQAATGAPPGPGDYADRPEETAWGPLKRLRPPVEFGSGLAMRWDRPASPLGSAPPAWR